MVTNTTLVVSDCDGNSQIQTNCLKDDQSSSSSVRQWAYTSLRPGLCIEIGSETYLSSTRDHFHLGCGSTGGRDEHLVSGIGVAHDECCRCAIERYTCDCATGR